MGSNVNWLFHYKPDAEADRNIRRERLAAHGSAVCFLLQAFGEEGMEETSV